MTLMEAARQIGPSLVCQHPGVDPSQHIGASVRATPASVVARQNAPAQWQIWRGPDEIDVNDDKVGSWNASRVS